MMVEDLRRLWKRTVASGTLLLAGQSLLAAQSEPSVPDTPPPAAPAFPAPTTPAPRTIPGLVPIRELPLSTMEVLGRDMSRQLSSAQQARTLLSERRVRLPAEAIWLASGTVEAPVIVFAVAEGDVWTEFARIDFAAAREGRMSRPRGRSPLAENEARQARARQRVVADMANQERCTPTFETIALPDPEQEGWLVWAVATTTNPDELVVGGHYRYSMDLEGREIRQRDRLFRSCLTLNSRQGVPAGARLSAFTVGWLISPTPLETHVFGNYQSGVPLLMTMMQTGTQYAVEGGRITPFTRR